MFGWDDAISGVLKIADKFIPNPAEKQQFEMQLAQLKQQSDLALLNADTQIATGQIETNKVEAASDDDYTRRARPTIMYICGAGFGYQYILQPFILLLITSLGKNITIPSLDMTAIGTVLLGLCGLRSFDKFSVKR